MFLVRVRHMTGRPERQDPKRGAVAGAADLLVGLGGRVSRDTMIYVLGTSMVLPLGLATVAVLTHYLEPAEYGRLAVLFVFASLLTTVYNLGTLQGSFMWVFGVGEDDADVSRAGGARAGKKREALTTGLLVTAGISTVATIPLLVAAEPMSRLLLGDESGAAAVRWAAVSAALGAVFRLVVNVFRMERHPVAFGVANTLRPTFVLAISIPLVVTGHGVEGAVAGTALGTLAVLAVCLVLGRRSYALAFSVADARRIATMGWRFVPVIVGLWVAHNADVLLLSRYAAETEVGLFRLANRVAVFVSYLVSAFLMAWSPLENTSLLQAADSKIGRGGVRARFFTYYAVGGLTVVLVMSIAADVLVRIAAPAYYGAAPLIPLIGLGFVTYGAFIVIVRAARIQHRNLMYGGTALGCGALVVVLGMALIPPLGSYGAALAPILAMSAGCSLYALLAVRSSDPLPLEGGRLLHAVLLSGAALAAARWLAPTAGGARVAAELAILAAYGGLLVALRIVPAHHLRPLLRMARTAARRGGRSPASLVDIGDLSPDDRVVLGALLRDRLPSKAAARLAGVDETELSVRATAALSRAAHLEVPAEQCHAIGTYLLSDEPPAERDSMARSLWEKGVDPFLLHQLEGVLDALQRLPRRSWPAESGREDCTGAAYS